MSLYNCFFCFSSYSLTVSGVSNYQLRFLSKLTPPNSSQYRGVVGVLNSRFIHIKHQKIFKNVFDQNKIKLQLKKFFAVYTRFLVLLLISSSLSFLNLFWIKARFISSSVAKISYISVLLKFMHHISLYLIIFNRSGDIEKLPYVNLIYIKVFYLATEI